MNEHTNEVIEQNTDTLQFRAVIDMLNHKRDGFFIEMGAVDGVLGSNTYCLEKLYGWNGILIEPIKDYFEQIPQYRNTKYQLNICIGQEEGLVPFTRIEGYSKCLSGISSLYSNQHRDRILREVQERNQQVHVDLIPCKKLITVLNDCGVTHVDYLSIDVEGGELFVIKSMEMETNPIRPIIIGCENNYNNAELETYLNKFSYLKVGSFGGDDFFRLQDNK